MDANSDGAPTHNKFLLNGLKSFFANIIEQFSLPVTAWKLSREIIASILLVSFLINILALVFPLTLLQIYDRIIPNQSTHTLFWLVFSVFLSIIISAILQVTRSYVGSWADARFEHIIGCRAYENLMNCRINEYEKEGSGRHLKRISAISMLKNFYSGQLIVAVVDLPFVVIFLLLITYIGQWLVFIPIVIIAFLVYLVVKNSSNILKLFKTRQDNDDKRLNFIVETVSKIHTIKSNAMEAQMMRRYEHLQGKSTSFDYNANRLAADLSSDSMTFSQVSIVLVASFGGMMVFNGHLTVGALAACTLLVGRCLQPVNLLLNIWSRMQLVNVARDELNKVLEMQLESSQSLKKIKRPKGKIELQNISFRYQKDLPLLFDNFNMTIMPNETISISAENFSGKSTLMYFLMGMMRPSKGKILIDDQDIFSFQLESVRSHIAYMSGSTVLFKGTILENLTMFDKSLEKEAIKIVEEMGLSTFIEYLPDGFDTRLGYQSSEILSRGVMQRLAIARSLVKNPQIILFDEANIALDRKSDEKVIDYLKKNIGKYTIIIVSYRESLLSLASKRYIVKNGKLKVLQ